MFWKLRIGLGLAILVLGLWPIGFAHATASNGNEGITNPDPEGIHCTFTSGTTSSFGLDVCSTSLGSCADDYALTSAASTNILTKMGFVGNDDGNASLDDVIDATVGAGFALEDDAINDQAAAQVAFMGVDTTTRGDGYVGLSGSPNQNPTTQTGGAIYGFWSTSPTQLDCNDPTTFTLTMKTTASNTAGLTAYTGATASAARYPINPSHSDCCIKEVTLSDATAGVQQSGADYSWFPNAFVGNNAIEKTCGATALISANGAATGSSTHALNTHATALHASVAAATDVEGSGVDYVAGFCQFRIQRASDWSYGNTGAVFVWTYTAGTT